jgi:ParB/RepB/Spo0J family partition protein
MGRTSISAVRTKDRSPSNNPKLTFLSIADLVPDPRNPRTHDRAQIGTIAKSIESFGFNAPILVDRDNRIVAGHGRFEAAKLLKLTKVPVIPLEHLSEAQARAYMLADNKLTDRSSWNDRELALQLKELSQAAWRRRFRRRPLRRRRPRDRLCCEKA